ncbi:MAG: hypothetical protein CML66_10915 [Rhodobacteraceae bacterium]|nr:hypothetical protein [Paracoccaceae bacterium]MAY46653.1 hypothetical protein [Paracoccaceae bacterium]|tara:strand:+ start:290 stop:727 length:438 start_codon:yes stop_codon:yes gene_type:complete
MSTAHHSISRWKHRHGIVVWIGIALNLVFAIPLLVAPLWLMGVLGLPLSTAILWPRFAGGLLIILSVFYIPMTVDLDRFRIFAWLAILPSRSFGAVFFLGAILLNGEPPVYFIAVLIDGGIAIASLFCLIRVSTLEQGVAEGRVT